jgi:hypothetical protein
MPRPGITNNEFVVCVPAVYLGSAEVSILAFLPDCRINNLRRHNRPYGFEPRPAHHIYPPFSVAAQADRFGSITADRQ